LDPITHTFAGAALAAAGLRRATPLATAALLIGANAPDVDALVYFGDGFGSLAFRRGWTHGILALPLWPFVLTGLLLLWDRWIRLRRNHQAAPARAGPQLAVNALAVLTHPTLDWLNNYGMRWLMPFDGTWFYGDALFIIDPWLWLALGGVLFLRYSNRPLSIARWTVFWTVASLLVLANTAQLSDVQAVVPWPARALWVGGLATLVALRLRRHVGRAAAVQGPPDGVFAAVLGFVALYICAMVGASAAARAEVRAALATAGIANVERVMVAPVPASPFVGEVVAATADTYYTGRWRWFAQPQLEIADEALPRPRGEAFEAAARARDAQQFLSWARFPVAEIERDAAGDGFVVRFSDARYRTTGRLNGPTVRLDRDLEIRDKPLP
jgi:inner membrane protein